MEKLEKQESPTKSNFFQYLQVILALLLFIFAIDLLTVGVGNINGGIALDILNATKNPFISLFIGLLVTALIQSSSTVTASLVAMTQGPSALVKLATAPKHLFFAGVLLAFYVLSITAIAPKFGVGNAIFFVLIGQLISAAAIDHFGLFGAQQIPLTWTRLSGLLLMAAGVLLTQKA